MKFHGDTFNYERDHDRLYKQLKKILDFTLKRKWVTLAQIEKATGYPQSSVSARLRTIRGELGYVVEREHVKDGLHRYRVVK